MIPGEKYTLHNISKNEINARVLFCVLMGILTLSIAFIVFILKAWTVFSAKFTFPMSSLWGIMVFLPLLGTFLGYLEAKKKTGIVLAARGKRNLDKGVEEIENQELAAKLKSKAKLIVISSIIISACTTAAFVTFLKLLNVIL